MSDTPKLFKDAGEFLFEPGIMNLCKRLEKDLGFGMELKEMQDLLESIKLVQDFFTLNPEKTALWFTLENPLLGNVKPIDLFFRGRGHKVLSFIKNSIDENKLK